MAREDYAPAPSSSVSLEQAQKIAESWWQMDKANHWFIGIEPTGSMVPLFDSRSVLLIERLKEAPRRGDAVAWMEGERLITHRVGDVKNGHAYISGINNRWSDGWIPCDRLLWRVVGIIYTERRQGTE